MGDPRAKRAGWLPTPADQRREPGATEPFAHTPAHVDPDPIVRMWVPCRGYDTGYDCAPTREQYERGAGRVA